MHFVYSIQRMPAFYVLNMIVPIVLMFFLSIFVFYLPTEVRLQDYTEVQDWFLFQKSLWKNDAVDFDFDLANCFLITLSKTDTRNSF